VVFFPSLATKTQVFSSPPRVPRGRSISLSFICPPQYYLAKSTNQEAPYYSVFSSPVLPPPF